MTIPVCLLINSQSQSAATRAYPEKEGNNQRAISRYSWGTLTFFLSRLFFVKTIFRDSKNPYIFVISDHIPQVTDKSNTQQQTRDVEPMLVCCWSAVWDPEPKSSPHRIYVSFLSQTNCNIDNNRFRANLKKTNKFSPACKLYPQFHSLKVVSRRGDTQFPAGQKKLVYCET